MVLLRLQPCARSSVVNRPCPKLAFKFFGSYKVLEKVGEVAYCLELPTDAQIYPVFHVSSHYDDLSYRNVVPLEVLDHRLVKKGNRAISQVFIR